MRTVLSSKSITLFIGISACSVTGYLLYLLFKKDEDEDDYQSTLPKKSNCTTVEVRVPKSIVGALIGRNGKNLKEIEEESHTHIRFKKDCDDQDEYRVGQIKGMHDACLIAQNLIKEFVENQPVLKTEDMWVPQEKVGKIVGRCGEQIIEICNKSGAKINVSSTGRNDPNRRIIIRGTLEQISLAKSLIEKTLTDIEKVELKIKSTLAKREPRVPLKAPSPILTVENPQAERMSPLPGQTNSQFDVYVSAMIDPSHFWLQIVGPKATELDQLVEEMTDYYGKANNRDLHVLNSINCGDLVAVIFQFDRKWYRAEVLNILTDNRTEPHAELYYVDYGDTDILPCTEVYELRTDFLRLNFQAIECYLANVEPVDTMWSEEAVNKFEEWTHVAQWKKLSARMNGFHVREKMRANREGSPVPGVDLYDVGNDRDIDIAQELVNHGFAIFKNTDLRTPSRRTTSSSNASIDLNQ